MTAINLHCGPVQLLRACCDEGVGLRNHLEVRQPGAGFLIPSPQHETHQTVIRRDRVLHARRRRRRYWCHTTAVRDGAFTAARSAHSHCSQQTPQLRVCLSTPQQQSAHGLASQLVLATARGLAPAWSRHSNGDNSYCRGEKLDLDHGLIRRPPLPARVPLGGDRNASSLQVTPGIVHQRRRVAEQGRACGLQATQGKSGPSRAVSTRSHVKCVRCPWPTNLKQLAMPACRRCSLYQ